MLKQLIDHRAAIRSTVPGLCAILIALASFGVARGDEPVIRMAGTFNNWSTNNDDYRLTKVDDHYELVRFWPCGKYEFKFVFDGSWSKHLGMGDDGKLRQPGRDIEWCAEQSAVYVLVLDNNLAKWRATLSTDSRHRHDVVLAQPKSQSGFQENLSRTKHSSQSGVPRAFRFSKATRRSLRPDLIIERVDLVGDFNAWRPSSLAPVAESREEFEDSIVLSDGLYHYKFLVNGCLFLEDPNADPKYREPDGKGGFNSGFRIGVDPATLGAAKADDVNETAVKHDPADASYFARIGHDLMTLRVRTLAGDAKGVSAQFLNTDGAVHGEPIELSKAGTRDGFEYWSAVCSPANGAARYTFLIEDGKEHCILDADGAHSFAANEKIALLPRPFEPDTRMSFETPDWAKRAVWYQIFPERFRNGDPSNDPPTTVPWGHEWYKPYKGSGEGTKAKRHKGTEGRAYTESGDFWDFIFDRRYGGDIQGVKEKLPYLRKLGVTAIYFNPMFLAESMHKYDASDYRHIDDYFGVKDSLSKIKGETTDPSTWQWSETDKIFLDFVKEAHRLGFKVVLDGVFNHVGRDFWAFKDVMKNGEKSEYVGWFDITSFKPFHYKAWDKDDGSLPRLKHDDALGLATPVREHLFAVTRRWMDPNGDGDPSDGIDGWRLDVAADVNANFWRDWRKLVKSINPEAYIVAEIWEESKSWLDGQTFDAVMNYPFARAAQRFFVNQKKASKPSEFQAELQRNLDWYAPQVNYVLQNLYCSHDTDRVASMFMNPDLEYDKENRQQDNGPNYVVKRPTSECYHKLRAMVAFQMTFLGAPMIYYGDEVGLYGADDPSDRKPMYWEDLMPYDDPDERIEPGLFEYHQRLIAIRNTFPALQLGSFEPLIARDDHGVFAFCRSLGSERVVVVFNNSDKPHRLDLPSPWPEGTHVDRADDPKVYDVVEAKDAASRAVVRPTGKHKPSLKVENGRLHGSMIEPRTAAIFVKS